jgi:hypothetical protein
MSACDSPPQPSGNDPGRGYHAIKFTSYVLVSLCLLIQLVLALSALPDALANQALTGGGRAQAEFFLVPMFLFGGALSLLCLALVLLNVVVDAIARKARSPWRTRNILLYLLLFLVVLLPSVSIWTLLEIMYAGWE